MNGGLNSSGGHPRPNPQSYSTPPPPSTQVQQRPGPSASFSASSLLTDNRESFEILGGPIPQPQTQQQRSFSQSTPQQNNINHSQMGRAPSFSAANPQARPQQGFSASSLNSSTGGFSGSNLNAQPTSGGFSASSLNSMPRSSSSSEIFPSNTPPTTFSASSFGNFPPSDDGGGVILNGGFAPMQSSSGGFTASSLIGSFNSDEAEMLRGAKATTTSGGGGGFTLSPMMLPANSGSGEDGSLLGAPAIGLLPSSTPQMMAAESNVEKGLDRVEDDLVHFSKNFQIILKGGTIAKVVEKLTAESQADNSVVDTFLLTYRKFISPELLLEELMKRYNLPPPQPLELMDQHSIGVYDHSLKIVRLRVGNFIKRWLSEHFQDFRGNEALIDRLAAMCKQTFLLNEKALGEKILNTLEEQRKKLEGVNSDMVGSMTTRGQRPDPIVPKSSSYADFDPVEVARQLCLFEQSIYRQIHPKECLDQCWSKKDRYTRAPNMMRLIDFFNHVASWVATTILSYKHIDDRVKEIKRFMRIAIELRRNNNFNGCQEVLAGLNDSSIYRLRASWMKVEKDEKLMVEFDDVKKALSPDRSWINYRSILKEIQPPCIPYLGVYLTDLTFIEDGNPNYLPTVDDRKDIINFEKCRKQALVIGNILLYQQDMYNFQRIDTIYDMFARGLKFIDDKDKLHKMSREIETQEMVEEAKRKAAKKAEKEQKKKADATPTKGATPSKGSPASSFSTPPRGSISQPNGSPAQTSSPNLRFYNTNPDRR